MALLLNLFFPALFGLFKMRMFPTVFWNKCQIVWTILCVALTFLFWTWEIIIFRYINHLPKQWTETLQFKSPYHHSTYQKLEVLRRPWFGTPELVLISCDCSSHQSFLSLTSGTSFQSPQGASDLPQADESNLLHRE